MSEGFIGEIRMFAGNFAPRDWMQCNGQILPISQYQALYSILGKAYGGDGIKTFGLPNLNGRVPMHFGQQGQDKYHTIGEADGESSYALSVKEMPTHSHSARLKGANQGNKESPAGNVPGASAGYKAYSHPSGGVLANMDGKSLAVGNTGMSTPHENMQPYAVTNFIICVVGIYPPRS